MKWFAFLLLIIFPTFVLAVSSGGLGAFSTGLKALDMDSLNTSLSEHGYETLTTNQFTLGGGGYALVWKRFLFGGEGYGILPNTLDGEEKTAKITMGYGFGSFGVAPVITKHFLIAPIIGFGGYGILMRLIPDDIERDFGGILDDPARISELTTSGFMTTFQCKAYFLFPFTSYEDRESGLTVGASAGYNWALRKGDWSLADFKVHNAPETSMDGFFIHVEVGGYGFNM